ncbi:hypothetical protein ACWGH9_38155, partial [Streptomyces chryseus]
MTAVTDDTDGVEGAARVDDVRDAGEVPGAGDAEGAGAPDAADGAAEGRWDDGLIARRAEGAAARDERAVRALRPVRPPSEGPPPDGQRESLDEYDGLLPGGAYGGRLRGRLDALRELVGLSRTRLDGGALAEAGRGLDEAAARPRRSTPHPRVAGGRAPAPPPARGALPPPPPRAPRPRPAPPPPHPPGRGRRGRRHLEGGRVRMSADS